MKEHPILFNAEMVRAILNGTKTQTRRTIKGIAFDWIENAKFSPEFVAHADNNMCPYGSKGHQLWVRETCAAQELESGQDGVRYFANDIFIPIQDNLDDLANWIELYQYRKKPNVAHTCKALGNTVPSIHMPRWASRIQLEILGIRAEQLKEISETDSLAEGVTPEQISPIVQRTAYSEFKNLWCSTYGGESWDANPWVWVIEFKRIEQ